MAAGRRWPWRAASIVVVLAGLCLVAPFTFLMWFTLGMRAFEGDQPDLGHWVVLGSIDLAALAFVAWGAAALRRRT